MSLYKKVIMNKNFRINMPGFLRRCFPLVLLLVAVSPVRGALGLSSAKTFSLTPEKQVYWIGSTLLTAACIYTFDEQINRYYASPRNGLLYDLGKGMSDLTQFYGANNARVAYFYAGLTSAFYAGGWLSGNERMKHTSLLLTRSMVYTLAATFGTKMIIGRARPGMKQGAHEFYWFEFSKLKERRSFLSGHTATAFALMTVLAREYPKAQIPAYLFAVCVGAQRIVTGEHWASDVIVGGLTGYWIGKAVTAHRSGGKAESRTSLTPYIFPGYLGVTIYF
ncbi:MAG: phosphatase PAP2 family protein [FCB group bacterium]|nr:phosphatase PAP2 family protein [FCB group bacterium]